MSDPAEDMALAMFDAMFATIPDDEIEEACANAIRQIESAKERRLGRKLAVVKELPSA